MQLNVNGLVRGVRCDLSGEELFDNFTYYSLTGQQFYVNQSNNVINPGPKNALDIDISSSTFDEIWGRVRDNLGSAISGTVKCDLSPKHMRGEFKYWKLNMVKVDVHIKEVKSDEQTSASIVSGEEWDFNASDEEIQILIETQKRICAEPFDEKAAPKLKKKREVLKIPAPISKLDTLKPMTDEELKTFEPISDEEIDNALIQGAKDAGYPSRPFPPLEIVKNKPDIPDKVDDDRNFYQQKAVEIIKKSHKKVPPASPITQEPNVEFEPEITKKKVKLPNTGSRVNIKRRKSK